MVKFPNSNYLNKLIIEKSELVDKVLSFSSASEALSFFRSNSTEIDGSLILLDINMPIMNGWEFLESYGNFEKVGGEKIVLLTSSISPSDKKKAEGNPHVSDYRSKPLSFELLQELINTHLN